MVIEEDDAAALRAGVANLSWSLLAACNAQPGTVWFARVLARRRVVVLCVRAGVCCGLARVVAGPRWVLRAGFREKFWASQRVWFWVRAWCFGGEQNDAIVHAECLC